MHQLSLARETLTGPGPGHRAQGSHLLANLLPIGVRVGEFNHKVPQQSRKYLWFPNESVLSIHRIKKQLGWMGCVCAVPTLDISIQLMSVVSEIVSVV